MTPTVAFRVTSRCGRAKMDSLLREIHFKDGLVPAVVVDAEGGGVLTLCYMNEDALRETLRTGLVHVFRRSRGRVMKKGEQSGHVQHLRELRIDCEGNSVLLAVEQRVAACHKGYVSCYFRRYNPTEGAFEIVERKVFEPAQVYEDGAG